ncbi:hypothetical protein F909_02561 [Acinetobacter sp. ANC 3929]|uniref:Arc family DNA-binding protein n=1 Tax=unclassified Acinetobacter TaxID=196816 RepID=UPI0002CF087E|nr:MULTISPECIES: Arc family DNA-binding protein [unclassified Acinetobacter]ENW81270.1 hypothetical protein F909_02561 [Acinetobacter sp. ANC 3929]MCH7352353.1 Arc family DNA-binding protein [Acinetobacter sp. NIPH 2023]MCH7356529.1 Arc family DNA-binding protein [Acinetobacter sp. NIPH 1958]MCH7358320.1 Arc family DNA-binding protein [Acinetobacter sp. NIPH 2024]
MNEDDNKVVTLKVRVSPEFREKLVDTAKENNRSMNAEIVDRLEKSFDLSNKKLEDLSADELIYFIFNKLNSRGLALTVEEIKRGEELAKNSKK